MADLTPLEENLAEVLGLAKVAQNAADAVSEMEDAEDFAADLERMSEQAAETERRTDALIDGLEGKKTAIREMARETKGEAVDKTMSACRPSSRTTWSSPPSTRTIGPPVPVPTAARPRASRPRHTRSLRIASIPAGHVYVRHLSDPDRPDGVVRLPDVPPPDRRKVPGGWWPPVMLDAGWIERHHDAFDVFHVHFGFDAKTPQELSAVAVALREAGVPLVVTVHDLRNPHHADTALHDAQLGVLLEHAAAVVTLTPGAARAIADRWDRTARVLPHPHVVEWDTMRRPRPDHEGFVVGVHAKSLRANMDLPGVADALATAVADLPGARLRIDIHDEVFEPGSHFHAPEVGAYLEGLANDLSHVELRRHPYFSDDELWAYFLGLDVSVLPYAFGTHSGWLEACHDLGTAIVAPDCGFYGEQRPCEIYHHDERQLDADGLAAAVQRAYAHRPAPRADAGRRRQERRALAAAHRSLYAALAG